MNANGPAPPDGAAKPRSRRRSAGEEEGARSSEAVPTNKKGFFTDTTVCIGCKHCQRAGCLEACPTGAIVRTEFDTVFVQPDICNGCGYCITGCPFGVIDRREDDGRAWKCTMCYDRLSDGMTPACAQACPTDSIVFGDIDELKEKAVARVEELHDRGLNEAYLYGVDAENQPGTDGLNAFFLLVDDPEVYNLPPDPVVPTRKSGDAWKSMGAAVVALAVARDAAVLC